MPLSLRWLPGVLLFKRSRWHLERSSAATAPQGDAAQSAIHGGARGCARCGARSGAENAQRGPCRAVDGAQREAFVEEVQGHKGRG